MKLPKNKEQDIVNYLHLEFGENPTEENSLKVKDLRYEGKYIFNGIQAHFWWFPCHKTQCWAILQPYEDSYLLSMTAEEPYNLEKA